METILLTGFEPFGRDNQNPSQDIANALHGTQLTAETKIVGSVLPVVREASVKKMISLIENHAPGVVIMLGQSESRGNIVCVEKVAINHDDFKIPDNAGNQPFDARVVEHGPMAYFSELPVKRITERIRQTGVHARVSYSAGTFVCNHLFYGTMHHIKSHDLPIRACFVHVPHTSEHQSEAPAILKIRQISEGIRAACEASIGCLSDLSVSEGTID